MPPLGALLVAASLAIAAVLSGAFLFPLVAPKVHAVEILALALGACLAAAFAAGLRLRAGPLTLAVLGTLAAAALAAFAGVDPHASSWGSEERRLGVVTLGCVALWYLAAAHPVRGETTWRRLVALAVAVNAAVCLLGVAEALGAVFPWTDTAARAGSTFGQPTYLGALGAGTVLLTALVPRSPRAVAAAGAVAGVAAVVACEARTPALALAAGATAFGLARLATAPRGSRERRRAAAALAVLLCLAAVAAALVLSGASQSVPGLRRFAHPTAGSGSLRLVVWQTAFDAVRERPLLGWGPSNFLAAHEAHLRPELRVLGEKSTWVDHAHSVPIETMATEGFVGLAVWLAAAATVFLAVWNAHRRVRLPRSAACAATGFLVVRLVQDLFTPPDATSRGHESSSCEDCLRGRSSALARPGLWLVAFAARR